RVPRRSAGAGFAAGRGAGRDPQDRRHVLHDARRRRALHRHLPARRDRALQGVGVRRRSAYALMSLLKGGKLVPDTFVDASGAEAIPPAGPVIVSLDQWQKNRDALLARGTPLGVRLHSDQSPESIADDVQHFALVALEFPKFRDGRAYSYARLL